MNDNDVSEVRCEVRRASDRADAVLRFTVLARSHDEAMQLVRAIESRSMEQVAYPVEELPSGPGWVGVDVPAWDPMHDIRPVPSERPPQRNPLP